MMQPYMYPQYQQTMPPYDRLTQLQSNYQAAMAPYAQMQQQAQVPIQPIMQPNQFLSGQMVDSIESVKAKDVDMSGSPVYYPKTDGSEIYRKQLQADGRSRIFVYRLINPDQQQVQDEPKQVDIVALFDQLRNDVHSEISGLRELVGSQMTPLSAILAPLEPFSAMLLSLMRLAPVSAVSLAEKNAEQAIINMMKQQAGNNPVMNNAINMMEKGDNAGIEQLARNLCKERGINPDDMLSQVKNQFGIK